MRGETRLEQFALPFAHEERIFLVKMLFSMRQNLQTNSKDALVQCSWVRGKGPRSSGPLVVRSRSLKTCHFVASCVSFREKMVISMLDVSKISRVWRENKQICDFLCQNYILVEVNV